MLRTIEMNVMNMDFMDMEVTNMIVMDMNDECRTVQHFTEFSLLLTGGAI